MAGIFKRQSRFIVYYEILLNVDMRLLVSLPYLIGLMHGRGLFINEVEY
jgi:hypothetical protein